MVNFRRTELSKHDMHDVMSWQEAEAAIHAHALQKGEVEPLNGPEIFGDEITRTAEEAVAQGDGDLTAKTAEEAVANGEGYLAVKTAAEAVAEGEGERPVKTAADAVADGEGALPVIEAEDEPNHNEKEEERDIMILLIGIVMGFFILLALWFCCIRPCLKRKTQEGLPSDDGLQSLSEEKIRR